MTLVMSNFAFVVSATFIKYLNARTMTININGANPINSHLHDTYSMIKPDNVGAMAGAKIIAKPIVPIILPRFSLGYKYKITVINRGIIIPAPMA